LQSRHEVRIGESAALVEMDNLWLAITCQRNFQGIDSVSWLLESFQLSTFLENRSTIATRSRKYFCSGMVVISVAQTWSATLTCHA
jgi:hypothetical protein